jgi:hypothetical protein
LPAGKTLPTLSSEKGLLNMTVLRVVRMLIEFDPPSESAMTTRTYFASERLILDANELPIKHACAEKQR